MSCNAIWRRLHGTRGHLILHKEVGINSSEGLFVLSVFFYLLLCLYLLTLQTSTTPTHGSPQTGAILLFWGGNLITQKRPPYFYWICMEGWQSPGEQEALWFFLSRSHFFFLLTLVLSNILAGSH